MRFSFGPVSIFLKVSHHVVLVGDSQNDKLKKENPDFRFYSLYPHVPLQCNKISDDMIKNEQRKMKQEIQTVKKLSKVP